MRFDAIGEVIGVALISVKRLLDQDGYLTITFLVPSACRRMSRVALSARVSINVVGDAPGRTRVVRHSSPQR